MEAKLAQTPASVPIKRLSIFWTILLFIALIVGVWYARSNQAQDIVTGVISNPADILLSHEGRTNVLLLGMGGEGHAGGDLTDSILFVSFNLGESSAHMVPLPRDIWIPEMQAKLNTAYFYGQERYEGGGLDLAKTSVSTLLGLPVHYVVLLDFQGFVKAIDAVGGIEVDVENTFEDFKYPIPGKELAQPESERYEHLRFEAGTTHMDGSMALKFARSRYAEGHEGTDFARGERQSKIIMAFRDKVLSTDILFNSEALGNLKSSVAESIKTDIDGSEQGGFLKVFMNLKNRDNIKTFTIEEYLTNPKITKDYGGQWVLVPAPSLIDLQTYVKTQLAN